MVSRSAFYVIVGLALTLVDNVVVENPQKWQPATCRFKKSQKQKTNPANMQNLRSDELYEQRVLSSIANHLYGRL
jgi:hypothetical protein